MVIGMPEWKNRGLMSKTKYSLSGLKAAFKTEKAVRNEFVTLVVLTAAAVYFTDQWTTVLKVFLICLLPITIEMINSAFETIIDATLGSTYREDVRIAKDMLSAAVLLALIISYATSILLIFFKN
jgi:diacylglycerol kinase (ATP)